MPGISPRRELEELVRKTCPGTGWSHSGRAKSTIGCARGGPFHRSLFQELIPWTIVHWPGCVDVFGQQLSRRTRPGLPSQHIPPPSQSLGRDPGRVSYPSPSQSQPLPSPRVSCNTLICFPPLSREAQQMRPSSISCKPPAGWTQSPEITPCPVASSSLAFAPSGLARISQSPNDWPGPGGSLGGRGLPPLLCGHPCSAPPGTRQGVVGWTPAPLAHAWLDSKKLHSY